ncbi:MAG TPA: LysR family transcriptional regulator substrate-binding protein, partial [Methylocella sp.]|nr:LysR family transcriptional regulator substrate-binding protein [Methylocella sp.]
YRLLTSAGSPLADRAEVTWMEVGQIPLCLLTPDMQNRRIIDRLLAKSAAPPPPVESNSMVALFSHVRAGRYACIVPERLANLLGVSEPLRSIPITEPREIHTIGLVSPRREPIPPLSQALNAEAVKLGLRLQASCSYSCAEG